jgi:hypothetical protein
LLSGCYAFRHALYQEVLYQRLAPGRRAQTHRRLGESLEQGYGARAPEVAPVLALHYELGHNFPGAVRHLALAAESSARRFSSSEAASYLSRALGLVAHLPAAEQSAARLKLLPQRAWMLRSTGDLARSLQDLTAMVACAMEAGQLRAEVNGLLDLSRFALPASPFMSAEAFIQKNPQTVENFIKALIEASAVMRSQKERGLAVMQKYLKTDRALAEIGYKFLLEDLTSYTFVTVKGLRTAQEIIALRDPKIARFNVEDLLDQRILQKIVQSGYVEEIERRYHLRP